ncbi:MAG: hypothetical protein U0R76_04690 [Candidatus Nanopelagicales bacterium]
MSTARPQEARPVLRLPSRSRAVPTATRMATRRVPALALPAIALLLGGGVVVAAQASGHWATTGRDALTSSVAQPSGSDGERAPGTGSDSTALPSSPEDVKGWMTLQQVVDARFPGVTESGLRSRFGIPASTGLDTALKDLDGAVAGFDVATLRTWLADPQ